MSIEQRLALILAEQRTMSNAVDKLQKLSADQSSRLIEQERNIRDLNDKITMMHDRIRYLENENTKLNGVSADLGENFIRLEKSTDNSVSTLRSTIDMCMIMNELK